MIRYHHILKSHWLDSKCNQHINCIIYTFIQYMKPYYQNWPPFPYPPPFALTIFLPLSCNT
jgi:hypothetical protein